ncbi:MAG: DUF2079 domain-containing protein [Candidatus Dormibacteraeota bacterium]|nr:DUF2079 domain-containing protein [Candidatus Dormibacteraeota bacterium]
MTELRTAVIIPARNEAGSIAEVVSRIRQALPAEIIVVDNGSNDGTTAIAETAGARVVHEPVRGYGYACLRGIAAATSPDVMVLIDGDGSMAPEDIPALVEPIASGTADIVSGSRRRRAAAGSMPPHQAFGNWLAVTLLRLLYGVRLTDLGPFRAVRASTLASLQMPPSRFAFLAEMLARAARRGARIVEVDVGYQARIAGQSKVGGSLRGSLEAGVEIIGTLLANRIDEWPAWFAGLAASLLYFLLAWSRYAAFRSTAYDLGFFDQVVWNAAHGHGLTTSFLEYSFFGEHFEPALLLFVPMYVIHATPLWLLLGQSLALGLAVVPLFVLARGWLDRRLAWLAVIAYLLQLGVSRAVAFDFHTEALGVPFVFLALLALRDRRRVLFLAAAAIPLLCKEDGALVALALGLLAALLYHERIGLLLSALAVGWGAIVLLAIMPSYRHGLAGDLIARYTYLGSSPGEVVLHTVTRPDVVIGHLMTGGALPAVTITLLGLGLLPLLRPWLLLIALVPLAPALLSADPDQSRLAFHYGIAAVPLLLTTALLGLRRVALKPVPRLGGTVTLAAGALLVFLVASPLPRMVLTNVPDLARNAGVSRALRAIPAAASVAATTSLLPHLSERAVIDEFPCGAGHASWIAVDRGRPPSSQSRATGYDATVAALPRLGYRPLAASGTVTIWYSSGAAAHGPASCFPSR